MTRRREKIVAAAIGLIFLLACDRILKYWALYGLYHTKIDIVPGWLTFELFKNTALSFSIPMPPVVIIPLSATVVALLAAALMRRARRTWGITETGLALIITGALSNLYDRLQYGLVIDYINIRFWPVFNLADVMISAGVFIIIKALIWRKK